MAIVYNIVLYTYIFIKRLNIILGVLIIKVIIIIINKKGQKKLLEVVDMFMA